MNSSTSERARRAGNRRSGGQILVDALRLQGVDTVFCIPGESDLAAGDAFQALVQQADLVIAVGTRFDEITIDGFTLFSPPADQTGAGPCQLVTVRTRQDLPSRSGDRSDHGCIRRRCR